MIKNQRIRNIISILRGFLVLVLSATTPDHIRFVEDNHNLLSYGALEKLMELL